MFFHELLILLVEVYFFLEILSHVLAAPCHNEKVLPEVQVVLPQFEQLLFSRVCLVFVFQKGLELRRVVVDIIDIIFVGIPFGDVVHNVELFFLFADPVAVVHEVGLFLLDKSLQIVRVYPRCVVKLKVQVLPLRRGAAQLLVEVFHFFVVQQHESSAEVG